MATTPQDMLSYVLDNELDYKFLSAVTLHRMNYSIAEIVDSRFTDILGVVRLVSPSYKLNLEITDDDIITAVRNGLYVSSFISRHEESYQVHFLVHRFPSEMKPRFEDETARDVVNYMILKTIIALRLDTESKIDSYVGI